MNSPEKNFLEAKAEEITRDVREVMRQNDQEIARGIREGEFGPGRVRRGLHSKDPFGCIGFSGAPRKKEPEGDNDG